MKRCPASLAFAFLLAAALPARAQTPTYVYDQQYTAPRDSGINLDTGESAGQSFTPTASTMNTAVFFISLANQDPSPGDSATLYAQVLAGDGLGGSVLGQSSDVVLPFNASGDPYGSAQTFQFPAPVALTPGEKYTLVVTVRSRANGTDVAVNGTAADGYAGGQGYSAANYTADFDFQEGITYPDSATAVHAFSGTDGDNPQVAPIVGNDGNLYGTTTGGGDANGDGTVYMVSPDGTTFKTLHAFNGGDGSDPNAELLQASDGFLYGTTASGGPNGSGTVFKVSTDGATFATLHAFGGFADPYAGLIQADDGFLYGVTAFDGTSGHGTVFAVSTDGTTFRTLHTFNEGDGSGPQGTLVEGLDGNLYGTTITGGAGFAGVVFMVSRDGQTFKILHALDGNDGFTVVGGLLLASDGNLYGTASGGGANHGGTLFMVSTDGKTFNVLHDFDDTDGSGPESGLLQASDGSLYGTTLRGGGSDVGTAFMISTDGKTFNSLYPFGANGDGTYPYAGLVQAGDGNFYGAADMGGGSGDGTVYRLDVTLPDVVQFHAAINSVNETAGTAMVRVDRIGNDGSLELFVPYTLTGGTAKMNTDYTDGSGGLLNWAQGDVTPKFITVNIVNRGFTDGSLRTLTLALSDVISESNGTTSGYPATATLTIVGSIPGAPVITSPSTATGTTGQTFSYQIAASASPTRYGVTGLPMGLSVGRKTGTITGTPQVPGTFTLTLNAYNKAGQGSKTLTLTVADGPPDITSASTASYTIGAAFSYQITANHHPTAFGVTGLPPGLSVNAQTGLITGTPTTAGTDSLTLNAYNAAGKGSQTLTLVQTPPTVTSAATASAAQGVDFSYQITAAGNATLFGVYGLPDGITVDAQTGVVSGQSKFAGTFAMTLNVYNSGGKGSQSFTLTVAASLPVVTSATTDSATVGTAYSYQITATNVPTSFGVTGLPPSLSVDASTGIVSGTPKVAGTFTLTLNAYNPAGKGSGTLTLTVAAP